jgi:hypothetical protein
LLLSEIISLISVVLALTAICISAWQARSNIRHAKHSRSLPVTAEIFREWRSREFRTSVHNLLALPPDKAAGYRFPNLSEDLREDAYRVCYFFDYIGTIVAFKIISEDIVIATMGTQIIQVWTAIFPVINNERDYRNKTFPGSTPPGFLRFYGHLVARIEALGGGEAAYAIQKKIGLQQPSSVNGQN